ncbi:MAG: endonuclease/exonuclease/phosphatase, partial [bacterium]|nr:endonuclease/exonuclease/phosphatase [bacterium]
KLSEIVISADSPAERPADRQTFTVMTYNIGYLSGMTNNRPIKTRKKLFEKNMATFLQLLEKNQPEFIAFQEIDFQSNRSYYVDQFQTILKKGGYKYGAKAVNWDKRYVPFPFGPPSVHFGKTVAGQAVLSRWPILEAKRILLQQPGNNPFFYNTFYLDRLVQMVKIKAAGTEFIILNVHLEAFHQKTREKQAQRVIDIYRSVKDA